MPSQALMQLPGPSLTAPYLLNPGYSHPWLLPRTAPTPLPTVGDPGLRETEHIFHLAFTQELIQFFRRHGLEGFIRGSKDGIIPFSGEHLCQPRRLYGSHQHAVDTGGWESPQGSQPWLVYTAPPQPRYKEGQIPGSCLFLLLGSSSGDRPETKVKVRGQG